MEHTTLRSFLQAQGDRQFIFRGRVVDSQYLTNHYSAYLDAQVRTEGSWVFFATTRDAERKPFACLVPVRIRCQDRRCAA